MNETQLRSAISMQEAKLDKYKQALNNPEAYNTTEELVQHEIKLAEMILSSLCRRLNEMTGENNQ